MSLKLYRKTLGSESGLDEMPVTLKDLLKSDNYMIHLRLDDEGDGLYDAILRADSLQDENCVLIPLVCSHGFKSTLDAFKTDGFLLESLYIIPGLNFVMLIQICL